MAIPVVVRLRRPMWPSVVVGALGHVVPNNASKRLGIGLSLGRVRFFIR